jgi:ketosteroid isomerase-like protein
MSFDAIAAAIAQRSRQFEAAYAAADGVALVDGYFAPDADQPAAYPPGGSPPVRGRAALTAMFAGMFAAAPAIRLETVDLIASGTQATEIGRAHLTGADGQAMIGRYVVCWIDTAAGWRARADFFAQDGWPG